MPGPVGRVLGAIYTGAVGRRNARFDAGRGVVTFDRPVISVGNLTLGGTGKTPMVARLVGLLREHGHDPCIAMRGYRAKRSKDGRSDEAELYRAEFDGLPVVAQPNRVEGLIKLFHSERGERVDCILLDDGFQHRRIARQVDILLLDATHDVFGAAVFPAGWLREPLAGARRATHLVVTHAEMLGAEALKSYARRAREAAPGAEHAIASHEWAALRIEHGGQAGEEPVSWLRGRRVVAACAIGRPAPFLAGIHRAGASIPESIVLPDHDPFSGPTLSRIAAAAERARAEAIVVTQKDWAKVAGRIDAAWHGPVAIPRLELRFSSGWEQLRRGVLGAAASAPD